MDFRENLTRIRLERHMTQMDLAMLLGVELEAVVQWENGDSEPPLKDLVAISDALQVSVDYLVGKNTMPVEPEAAAQSAEESTEDAIFCPCCGGIMMRGLITGSRDLARWTIDDGIHIAGVPDEGEFYLRNHQPKGFLENLKDLFNKETERKTAYVCYACGKLTADIKNLI